MKLIAIGLIIPLGLPNDEQKRDRIKQAMEKDGWKDRPLVVVSVEGTNKYQALTGSHRYDAAMRAKLNKIPVLVIAGQQLREAGIILEVLAHTYSDVERVVALRRARQNEAAGWIQLEIDANKKNRESETTRPHK